MKGFIKRACINTGKVLVLALWAVISVREMSINMIALPAVIASLLVIRFFMFDS